MIKNKRTQTIDVVFMTRMVRKISSGSICRTGSPIFAGVKERQNNNLYPQVEYVGCLLLLPRDSRFLDLDEV